MSRGRRRKTVPKDIEDLGRRIQRWRRSRAKHTPMPESLWREATRLAGTHGVSPVCRHTGLGYASLQKRAVFVFRNRKGTAIKALIYDGQGYWLCYKRLSTGRFRWWPRHADEAVTTLAAHELQVLLCACDPSATRAAPAWRPVTPQAAEAAARNG